MDIATLQGRIESASAAYADAHGIDRTDEWLVLKLVEEVGELAQAHLARSGGARDKGRSHAELEQDLRSELADVVGQALLLAERFGVDVTAEITRKWRLGRCS